MAREVSILAEPRGFQEEDLQKYLAKPVLSDLMVVVEDSSDAGPR